MGNRQDKEQNRPDAQSAENIHDSKTAERQHRDRQKGPQAHAEGQQGEKTHRAFLEGQRSHRETETVGDEVVRHRSGAHEGRHRLTEDRQQHDEAEKNSERNRLAIERERGREPGSADTSENIHGLHNRGDHRADYQERKPDGLR